MSEARTYGGWQEERVAFIFGLSTRQATLLAAAVVAVLIPLLAARIGLISDSGVEVLAYEKRYGYYRLRLTSKDVAAHRELLLDLIRRASKTPPSADE